MSPAAHEDDDEPDDLRCYRHPDRETALQCISCDRPICVDCAVQAAVGFKCPDCARTSRAARGVVPTQRAIRGGLAGVAVAVVLGSILAVAPIPFLGILLGYVVGIATGEVTRRASGGYRDPLLARIAATAAFAGVAALPLVWIATGAVSVQSFIWNLIAAAFAAYGAYTRAS